MIDVSARPELLEGIAKSIDAIPITITSAHSERSKGSTHDFYSEADYWSPDPTSLLAPFIRSDGFSNPSIFWRHRELLHLLTDHVASMTTAWMVTGDKAFVEGVWAHLDAWFCNPATKMNPNLQYSQAIPGIATGRSYGIVDTVHLVEVALSILHLDRRGGLSSQQTAKVLSWFESFYRWLLTDEFGKQARSLKNNHYTSWLLQVATCSVLLGDHSRAEQCRQDFKNRILSKQMAEDGSFPHETARTRPYNYSLFNLELMACLCQVLSKSDQNLWHVSADNGRCMAKAVGYMAPYLEHKKTWPRPPDVSFFDELPQRHQSFLFAGWAFREPRYRELWFKLRNTDSREMRRNLFARRPLLWYNPFTLPL